MAVFWSICLLLLLQAFAVTHAKDLDDSFTEGCVTPQYLRQGEMGIVKCSFQDFYSVYWYNSTDSENQTPLVALKGTTKSGDGYLSGKFDVFFNGSFVIENVSEENDHFYRALVVQNKEGGDYETYDVRVYVTVRSKQVHPYIKICGEENFCFAQVSQGHILDCTVTETQPAVDLAWVFRGASGDQNVSSEVVVSVENKLYTAISKTTTSFEGSSLTELLVCKVSGPPNIISVSESMVLVENMDKTYPSKEALVKHVKIGEELKLICSVRSGNFVLWKKASANGSWTSVLNVYFGDEIYSKIYLKDNSFDSDGSLLISQVGIDTEGTYMCIYKDGQQEATEVFQVTVFVPPASPAAVVQGCQLDERCVLEVQNEGILTCSVKGIRPKVELQWLPFPEENSKYISFFDREVESTKNGDTYDISVTSRYKLKDETQTTLAVECRVSGWDIAISDLDEKIELQFTTGDTDENKSGFLSMWIILVVLLLLLVVIVSIIASAVFISRKRKKMKESQKKRKTSFQSQEGMSLITPHKSNKDNDEDDANQSFAEDTLLVVSERRNDDKSDEDDNADAFVSTDASQNQSSSNEVQDGRVEIQDTEKDQLEKHPNTITDYINPSTTENSGIKSPVKASVHSQSIEKPEDATKLSPIEADKKTKEKEANNVTKTTEEYPTDPALPETKPTLEDKKTKEKEVDNATKTTEEYPTDTALPETKPTLEEKGNKRKRGK